MSAATTAAWRAPPRRCDFFQPGARGDHAAGLGLPALRPRLAQCRDHEPPHRCADAARRAAAGGRAPRRADDGQRRAAARAAARALPRPRAASSGAAGASPLDRLISFLDRNGYSRTDTVREAGEFAVRGGIVDLFPSGAPAPLRLDFFGDTLEGLRSFDPLTQRTHRHGRGDRVEAGQRGAARRRRDPALPHALSRAVRHRRR